MALRRCFGDCCVAAGPQHKRKPAQKGVTWSRINLAEQQSQVTDDEGGERGRRTTQENNYNYYRYIDNAMLVKLIFLLNSFSYIYAWRIAKIQLGKALIASTLLGGVFDVPASVFAVVNPEAIDIRRVEQQPVGAPAPEKTPSVKLASGLEYYDVNIGTGGEVDEGKTVQFQWVLRRQNGYFVDSSANYGGEPFI